LRTHTVPVARDPECPACGTRTITALIDYDEFCSAQSRQ
jgi:sulfur-carrier protein adenylyltransferase/sulfurtransferase